MRTSMTWLSAAGVALAVFAGCSSSSSKGFPADGGTSGEDGGSEAGVSAMQACADYAKATCTQANTCTPFTTAINFGDEATCEQRSILGCMPLLGIHGSTLTPGALDACAQAVMGETCIQYLDNHTPTACNFVGTLAAGDACGSGSQCQSGYCKIGVSDAGSGLPCGVCATRGTGCSSDNDCASDKLCAGGQCVTPMTPPGTCNNALEVCQRTTVCLGEQGNDAGVGTCQPPGMAGAPCQDSEDCAGGNGIICDVVHQKCVAAVTATTGQMCGIVSGSLVLCKAANVCSNLMKVNDAGPPVEGTCHEPAADGAPCGAGVGCTLPAVCSPKTFTCTLPDPGSCQ